MSRSLSLCLKMTRLRLAFLAAFSSWVAAMLSNGPYWLTVSKVAAPTIMFFGIVGASTFHFVVANPMYKRKNEHWVVSDLWRKLTLMAIGLAGMFLAMAIAIRYMNRYCQIVVVADAVIIVCYAVFLSRYWLTKNVLMAFVCVSPILLGWVAGHRTHPSVPYGVSATFFLYLAREIVKDVQDRHINHGYRLTLPLWLGVEPARRIAGTVMLVAVAALILFSFKQEHTWYVMLAYGLAMRSFLMTTHSLFFRPVGHEDKEIESILMGSGWLLLTFFLQIV